MTIKIDYYSLGVSRCQILTSFFLIVWFATFLFSHTIPCLPIKHSYPVRIQEFDNVNGSATATQIRHISAGVDMSMALSSQGDVYAWGKTEGGRLGLGSVSQPVRLPRKVTVINPDDGTSVKIVEAACGYVHSLLVGVDGTVFVCGGVGIDGAADGSPMDRLGLPRRIPDFNIWHRTPEPNKNNKPIKKERWKKFGKYEVRGRTKMMGDST
jgi:hypothetical protein